MCEITKSKEKTNTETGGDTPTLPPIHEDIEKLSSEDLEKRIISALNVQPNNAQLLGKAIEFFIKIRGKEEEIDDNIDMEALREIGITSTSSK